MDITKVDWDVAHVAYFGKCFQCYVASILKKNVFRCTLQQVFYLDVAMFHAHVASVLSR
jgi:hypothetical protein